MHEEALVHRSHLLGTREEGQAGLFWSSRKDEIGTKRGEFDEVLIPRGECRRDGPKGEKAHLEAQVLSRLHPGAHGPRRRDLAHRQGTPRASLVSSGRWGATSPPRSTTTKSPRMTQQIKATRSEQAQAEDPLRRGSRASRSRSGPFANFSGLRGRGPARTRRRSEGHGAGFRSGHPGGARLHTAREGLKADPFADCDGEAGRCAGGTQGGRNGKESDRLYRKAARVPPGRRTPRRRSGRRSVSTASTSWSSARRSTPSTQDQQGLIIPSGRDHGLRGSLLHLRAQ